VVHPRRLVRDAYSFVSSQVQTIFGQIVGATVHTYPWAVWVSEEGLVYEWSSKYCYYSSKTRDKYSKKRQEVPTAGGSGGSRQGAAPIAVGMPKQWRKRFGARMPAKLLALLQEASSDT
jgi:hypothetical protein